ncbi:hypothetical protein F5Y04DRAFT_286475 [Hypomontagnella monticulosa]|nr:hypothetical protein F5Y04DRAFT_286475 [Hypomontagnella monticulosa]
MGTPHRSRSRSSLGRLSQREYREDEDKLYLPGSGGIYLTTTKSGKPALARKKKDRLLEDIGIDLLGETFGIPSRREFERRARRRASMSALNQASPTPSSTVLDLLRHILNVFTVATIDFPATPPAVIPAPPPILPSISPHSTWNVQPLDNIIPGVTPSQVTPITPSGQPQIYPHQVTASGTSPNWGLPQTPAGPSPQYLSSTGYAAPQPQPQTQPQMVSVPVFLHQPSPTTLYPGNISPTDPIPEIRPTRPPPPPPLQLSTNKSQGENKGNDNTDMDSSVLFSPVQARKFEEHYNATLAANVRDKDKGEREQSPKETDLSRHMQHVHTCAACGKRRSKRYQKAHPLKRGQVPKQAYCRQCLHDAALMNTDGANGDSNSAASRTDEDADDNTIRVASLNQAHVSPDSSKGKKRGYKEKWKQKSGRLSVLSSMLPSSRTQKVASMSRQSPLSARKRSKTVPGPTVESDSSKSLESPPKETTRDAHHTMLPSDVDARENLPETAPRKVKRSVPKKDVRKGSSNTTAGPDLGLFIDISPVLDQNRSTQDEVSDASQKDTAPKSRSKIPRPILSKKTGSAPTAPPEGAIAPANSDTAHKTKDDNSQSPKLRKDLRGVPGSISSAKELTYGTGNSVDYKSTQKGVSEHRGHSLQQSHSYAMPRSKKTVRKPKLDRYEISGRSQAQRGQANTRARRQGAWEGQMDTLVEDTEDTPQDPTFDLPPTPVDPLYGSDVSISNFADDYSEGMKQAEQVAEKSVEKLAESDLASAGKMFDDFPSPRSPPWADSSTPPFNVSSHVTRTEISVESYISSDQHDDATPMRAFTLDKASETEEITEAGDELAKQLEFSSTVDKGQKIAAGTHGRTPSMYSSQPGFRDSQASTPKNGASKMSRSRGQSSSNAPDPSSNASSSVLAHTGHSMEDVRAGSVHSSASTVTGRRRRIRRPSLAQKP